MFHHYIAVSSVLSQILMYCDLLTIGKWGDPIPLRHADVLNRWSQRVFGGKIFFLQVRRLTVELIKINHVQLVQEEKVLLIVTVIVTGLVDNVS